MEEDTPPTPPPTPTPGDDDKLQQAAPARSRTRPERPAQPPAEPFAHAELSASLRRPYRMLDVVLGERRRLVENLKTGRDLRALVATLLACSALFAIPYGLVDGWGKVGHVALLFLGSVLLCVPSLLIFGSYLGIKLHWSQNLAIALVIPAAAALFTFGFAPIYWFLEVTMPDDGGLGGVATRVTLLVFSLLLALSHLNRCLFVDADFRVLRDNWALWVGWQILLVFLSYRMASTLGMFE
ncbi:MAG: hypothetical protein ACE37K_21450 [Planctomycetota bacterium]